MARIPMGNFGTVIAAPAPTVRIPAGAFDDGKGAFLQREGERVVQIVEAIKKQEAAAEQEVDNARAGSALVGFQSEVEGGASGIMERLAVGEIDREKASSLFDKHISDARQNGLNEIPPYQHPIADARFKRIEERARLSFSKALDGNRRQEIGANLDFIGATMAKDALRPGADIDGINREFAMAAQTLGPQAGMHVDKLAERIRSFQEGNWFNQAQARAMQSRDDLVALQALERDLSEEGGQYLEKLAPNKRNAILSSVISHRSRLESKQQILAERRETSAERTLARIDQQIASGVPASPEMWSAWEQAVQGTSHAGAFAERIKGEEEVQRLLREAPEKQAAYVRQREAELLAGGGSLRDKANVDRLKKALEVNRKTLQESPLVFYQNRTGETVQPIDVNALVSGNPEALQMVSDRVAIVSGLRRQYGDSIKARIMLPTEAESLTTALDRMAPDQQVQLFRGLRNAIGDDTAYHGALSQIAADSPVKALAGTLAARGVDYMKSSLFSPDETVSAMQTARLALLGESLLNPTRGQKAQDGKTNTFLMPKKADMLRVFADKVGDTFAGTPQAMDAQFELVQATYAGLLASRGGTRSPEVLDKSLFEQALERTTPVIKQGGVSFLKPIVGMSDDQFREKLHAALPDELKAQADRLPLRNVRSNQYVILKGSKPLAGPDGKPLIVTVQP